MPGVQLMLARSPVHSASHACSKHCIIMECSVVECRTYLEIFLAYPCSFTHADCERRCECTTSQTSLLTSAANDRVQSDSWSSANVACTNALWSIDLVSR